jgi:hypothetical protein
MFISSSSSSRPFYPSFNNVFYNAVPTQDVPNPVSIPLFYCMQVVPFFLDSYVIFLHSSQDRSKLSEHQIINYSAVWSLLDIYAFPAKF